MINTTSHHHLHPRHNNMHWSFYLRGTKRQFLWIQHRFKFSPFVVSLDPLQFSKASTPLPSKNVQHGFIDEARVSELNSRSFIHSFIMRPSTGKLIHESYTNPRTRRVARVFRLPVSAQRQNQSSLSQVLTSSIFQIDLGWMVHG